jgi:hypothetical protein
MVLELRSDNLPTINYQCLLADDKAKAYPIESGMLEQLGYVVGLQTAV